MMIDFSFLGSMLTFLALLSVLIIAHELGHFWVARRCGMKVERFGFGLPFGPTLWSKKIGEVEYCVHALLLGGYVSFPDDNPESEVPPDAPGRFENQPVWNRFAVAIAGVTVNAILAWTIMTGVYMTWGGPLLTNNIEIYATVKGGPADQAGIQPHDIIAEVDGVQAPAAGSVIPVSYFQSVFSERKNQTVNITVNRDNQLITLPVQINAEGKVGFVPEQQQIQLEPVSNPFKALQYSVAFLNTTISKNFMAMGSMIQGRMNPEMLSGPIEIISVGSETIAKHGIEKGLMLTAIISMVLAVMNLLPIPALDGGHILFILIEAIKGSPLRRELQEQFTQAGFVGLMLLMLFVLFNDGYKMFKRNVAPEPSAAPAQEFIIDRPGEKQSR